MPDTQRSPLGKALFEATVIILSILLAFAIDASWENRNEQRAEDRALRTLGAEFAANAAEFRYSMDWLGRNRAGALQVLEAIRSAPPGTAAAVPDSVIVNTLLVGSANPSTGALDGVLGAQGLDLFSDPSLRARIAAWPGELRDLLEDQSDAQAYVQGELTTLLGQQADISYALDDGIAFYTGAWSAEQTQRTTDVRGSTALSSALGAHIGHLDNVRLSMFRLIAATDTILMVLPAND